MEWASQVTGFMQQLVTRLQPLYDEAEARAIAHFWADERLDVPRHRRFLEDEAEISSKHQQQFQQEAQALISGKPVQYVTGRAYFYGEPFIVNAHVLIPRPETEELVAWILETIPQTRTPQRILDIGTGSGCIPITLKKQLQNRAELTAYDISEEALSCAQFNAQQLHVTVDFFQQDILQSQAEDHTGWDFIVSNPPYVLEQEADSLHSNVIQYEPHVALFTPDDDPIMFYKKIGTLGLSWLKAGGYLFFEVHRDFGEKVKHELEEKGYHDVTLRKDLRGNPRMIQAKKPVA
ncbi:MAG: peptide chain release factor N(5)-glutamine methyltransferase [Bacteroidota bacterium]